MSLNIVNAHKCSDGKLFLDKKEADAHETYLNLEAWVENYGDQGLCDVTAMVNGRDDLRHALNGVYLNRIVATEELGE